MQTEIRQQKELMQQALKYLTEIETVKSLIEPIDPVISKVLTSELQEKYSEVTSQLFKNFLIVSHELQQ